MDIDSFFASLWQDYTQITPQAQAVFDLFTRDGEEVINDHVAFRTLADCPLALEKLEPILRSLGYQPHDRYQFVNKKLIAKSYNHPQPGVPKIFVSELQREQLSPASRQILDKLVAQIPQNAADGPATFWKGRLWTLPSSAEYRVLVEESEYAAWLATMGLRANHFTVNLNHLRRFTEITSVIELLKTHGFAINTVGGEVKGSPQVMLEQASTMADKIEVEFSDGVTQTLPSCFYEFAKRYRDADGLLFEGFIADNADKIFESTHAA